MTISTRRSPAVIAVLFSTILMTAHTSLAVTIECPAKKLMVVGTVAAIIATFALLTVGIIAIADPGYICGDEGGGGQCCSKRLDSRNQTIPFDCTGPISAIVHCHYTARGKHPFCLYDLHGTFRNTPFEMKKRNHSNKALAAGTFGLFFGGGLGIPTCLFLIIQTWEKISGKTAKCPCKIVCAD